MRPAAALAHTIGALEADAPAELAPVGGIQVTKLSPDRHGRFLWERQVSGVKRHPELDPCRHQELDPRLP
jgi:hypothetical protein